MWEKIYAITDFLWGTPLMILMVGVGFFLSLRTGFFQITGIRTWWKATVGEILKTAGTDFSKVFKTTCFLADMNDFQGDLSQRLCKPLY